MGLPANNLQNTEKEGQNYSSREHEEQKQLGGSLLLVLSRWHFCPPKEMQPFGGEKNQLFGILVGTMPSLHLPAQGDDKESALF